jgi:hypothetical protein
MPTCYFCLHDNDDVIDADGTNLPDLDSAREHARQVMRERTFRRDGDVGAELVTVDDVGAR